ncbi:hypothetical protein DSO57_1005419 [Entomophthora muscae]|uniref:Uncharacterized protein n=1 Tax=Entomophthora muscae TaxID=34485 RepID=A0ACC2TVS5_9FUNG|nr:hypothetical protein DSO57_1005419 [Entomophthora muscae]
MDIDLQKFLVRLTGKAKGNPQAWEKWATDLVTFGACQGISLGAPLAFVSAAYIVLWGKLNSNIELALAIWSSTEIIFYFYCRYLLLTLERPRPEQQFNNRCCLRVIDEVIEGSICPKTSIAGWFVPNLAQNISRDDVRFWFSWARYGKPLDELTPSERQEADLFVKRVEDKSGPCQSESRRDGPGDTVVTNLSPVATQHKPLVFYIVAYLIQGLGNCILFSMGFQRIHLQETNMNYWFYEPTSEAKDQAPIFFLHGIGLGLFPYTKQLYDLKTKHPQRIILAIELPYISMIPVSRPHSVDTTIQAIDTIFGNHNIKACSWLCHSFGTFVAAWLVTYRPHYFSQLSMVDPVCFASWESDLMHNFFHTKSTSLVQRITHYFLARDIFLAFSVQRFFYWHQSVMLPENITFPTTVFLCEHDFLINSKAVQAYLKRAKASHPSLPIRIRSFKGLTHGSFLLTRKYAAVFHQYV